VLAVSAFLHCQEFLMNQETKKQSGKDDQRDWSTSKQHSQQDRDRDQNSSSKGQSGQQQSGGGSHGQQGGRDSNDRDNKR